MSSAVNRRVAFVTTITTPWGGSEELWCRTAGRLTDAGVAVSANALRTGPIPEPVRRLIGRGVAFTQRRGGARLPGPAARLHASWVYRWLDRVQPDLAVISLGVHTQGAGWMEACARRGIPYALVVQCAGDLFWPPDADLVRLADGYRRARACYFVSEDNRDLVLRQLAIALPQSAVVRNPFNVGYDAAPAWPEGAPLRLACVARLEAFAKGQDLLLQLLNRETWRERDVEISFFGTGPNALALQRQAESLGLKRAHFCGHAADVEGIWRRHHALILASRFEGLPLALVEAMLCGRAAVATDVGGNAELIVDGRTGFLATAPTVAALDEALGRVWAAREQLPAMGVAARERVRTLVPCDPVGVLCERLLSLL